MRNVVVGSTLLLEVLRSEISGAQSLRIEAVADNDGLALLEPHLSSMLAAGGNFGLRGPEVPPSLEALLVRYGANLTAATEPITKDARIAWRRGNGTYGAFLGRASLTVAGLQHEAAGVLLIDHKDRSTAASVYASLTEGQQSREHLPDFVALEDLLQPAMDDLPGPRSDQGVHTGLEDLDTLVGHHVAGGLWLVHGLPGSGKSTLCLTFARQVAIRENAPVAWLTTSDRATVITHKLLSAEALVPLHHIRAGTMTAEERARLAQRRGEITEAPLAIAELRTNATIVVAVRQTLDLRPDTRLLIIDGLPDTDLDCLEDLRRLAASTGTWIVATVDPAGRVTRQRVDLLHEGAADLVIHIHREDQHNRDSDRPGEADLTVSLNRGGPISSITCAFQGRYARFCAFAT